MATLCQNSAHRSKYGTLKSSLKINLARISLMPNGLDLPELSSRDSLPYLPLPIKYKSCYGANFMFSI